MPGVDPNTQEMTQGMVASRAAFELGHYRSKLEMLTATLLSNFGPSVLALSDDAVDKAVDRAERILTTCSKRSPK